MKKLLLSCALLLGATAIVTTQQSCTKDVVKAVFPGTDLTADAQNFTIPMVSSVNTNFISLDTINQPVNLDQEIKDATSNSFGLDDADKMYVKSIRMTLDDPTNADNWANFSELEVYVWSNTNTTPKLVGSATIPDTYASETTISCDASLNMKDYLSGQTIYYAISGKNRRTTSKALTGKAYISFRVE